MAGQRMKKRSGDMEMILQEVLSQIKPAKSATVKEAREFISKVNSLLKKEGVNATAVAGGSVAKGTFLRGDHDVDIFVKFNRDKYKQKDADMSAILGKVLRKGFSKVRRIHGSRDYYRISNGIQYEIVPVLNIRDCSNAENVTDCSPLHVRWVNSFSGMKKEIMLTKAFCKAAGIYGAESYIKGFSGHVVDIITIHYGGFLSLLKASKSWKKKQVIDHYKHHKGKALFNLNRSKTQSPLIVIDPVQPDRNAAAALDEKNFRLFRKRAAEFLKNPSKDFFVPEKMDISELKKEARKRGGKLILIKASPKRGKEDVMGAKLLKTLQFIIQQLSMNDFTVIDHGWHWDRKSSAVFWIITDRKDLPKKAVRTGPPVNVKRHYRKFADSHKNVFVKDSRAYAEVEREFTNAERFIKSLFKNSYIRERAGSIRIDSEDAHHIPEKLRKKSTKKKKKTKKKHKTSNR
ncbi:CCA tRNA nucleotidyltransferase [Candidatus Woesearchaeota archaeon]|nr:CCA tRNA nucleotidyltransferase [Candidatus Woesearchaeota archaeon]